jgi:hypothetical protein
MVPSKKGEVLIATFNEEGVDYFKPHANLNENGLKIY